MHVALLGSGKTGSFVAEQHQKTTVFNTKNPVTLDALKDCDVVISFLPGEPFLDLIPILVESALPVVTGSTGFEWPRNLNLKAPWIHATNFAMGMVMVKEMIEIAAKYQRFLEADLSIHEIHHTKKLDAPSGTALSWSEWANGVTKITHDRIEDVVGIHDLYIETGSELISIKHQAKDRGLFARGALWAAQYLIKTNLEPKLYDFSKCAREVVFKDVT